MGRARQEVAIADRLLHSGADPADPAAGAERAAQAAALRNELQRLVVAGHSGALAGGAQPERMPAPTATSRMACQCRAISQHASPAHRGPGRRTDGAATPP